VDGAESTSDSLTVVRGARKAYSFTLGLPVAVELEDIPDEVTAVLLGASCVYFLLAEGSSPIETPRAVRFARRLAEATHGAVLDQQTGQTWTRGKLRTAQRVEQGTVATVNVHWYVRSGFDPAEAA